MLASLAQISTNKLISKNVIEENKKDIYNYGFELLYSTFFVYITIVLISIISKPFIFSIIFILFFTPIRSYAGGFHASTYGKCYLTSNAFFLVAFIFAKLIPDSIILPSIYSMMLFTIIIIFFKAPIVHKNHPISQKKYLRNRNKARICIVVETIILCIWVQLNPLSRNALMAACTTAIVAFLIIIVPSERRQEIC